LSHNPDAVHDKPATVLEPVKAAGASLRDDLPAGR
jgi:hypothetical protein